MYRAIEFGMQFDGNRCKKEVGRYEDGSCTCRGAQERLPCSNTVIGGRGQYRLEDRGFGCVR